MAESRQSSRPRREAASIALTRLWPSAIVDRDSSDDDQADIDESDMEEADNVSEVNDVESNEEDSSCGSDEDINSPLFASKDGRQWQAVPQNNPRGRPPQHNILRETGGPVRHVVQSCVSRVGALRCFITTDIICLIVKHTNEEGHRVLQEQWVDTDVDEIETYFGLLILSGVYRGRSEPISHLWSREQGRPIFSQAMARNRFQQLTRMMRFDQKDTRIERRTRDKMAPIREVHDKFAARCRSSYKPSAEICVDEQLVTFRGRCPFKVYIPSKPGKYGMKVWVCCDVQTSYVCNLELYTGRQGHTPETDQAKRVVLQMTSPFVGSGRGCTADNFFSSISLSEALLSRQITYCGTVRKNRRFLPPAILNIKHRQVNSSVFAFDEKTTLVSYVPKKGKNVVLMSTQHHNDEVDSEREDKKPEIILHYNRTKGAVDTLDKLVRTYSCQRKSRRWPMVFFQNILDIAAYNAAVVFFAVNPDIDQGKSQRRRLFLENLAMEMLSLAIMKRQTLIQPLPCPLPSQQYGNSERPRKRTRCGYCPSSIDRKTVEKCSFCNKAVCKDHLRVVCNPTCK